MKDKKQKEYNKLSEDKRNYAFTFKFADVQYNFTVTASTEKEALARLHRHLTQISQHIDPELSDHDSKRIT